MSRTTSGSQGAAPSAPEVRITNASAQLPYALEIAKRFDLIDQQITARGIEWFYDHNCGAIAGEEKIAASLRGGVAEITFRNRTQYDGFCQLFNLSEPQLLLTHNVRADGSINCMVSKDGVEAMRDLTLKEITVIEYRNINAVLTNAIVEKGVIYIIRTDNSRSSPCQDQTLMFMNEKLIESAARAIAAHGSSEQDAQATQIAPRPAQVPSGSGTLIAAVPNAHPDLIPMPSDIRAGSLAGFSPARGVGSAANRSGTLPPPTDDARALLAAEAAEAKERMEKAAREAHDAALAQAQLELDGHSPTYRAPADVDSESYARRIAEAQIRAARRDREDREESIARDAALAQALATAPSPTSQAPIPAAAAGPADERSLGVDRFSEVALTPAAPPAPTTTAPEALSLSSRRRTLANLFRTSPLHLVKEKFNEKVYCTQSFEGLGAGEVKLHFKNDEAVKRRIHSATGDPKITHITDTDEITQAKIYFTDKASALRTVYFLRDCGIKLGTKDGRVAKEGGEVIESRRGMLLPVGEPKYFFIVVNGGELNKPLVNLSAGATR